MLQLWSTRAKQSMTCGKTPAGGLGVGALAGSARTVSEDAWSLKPKMALCMSPMDGLGAVPE